MTEKKITAKKINIKIILKRIAQIALGMLPISAIGYLVYMNIAVSNDGPDRNSISPEALSQKVTNLEERIFSLSKQLEDFSNIYTLMQNYNSNYEELKKEQSSLSATVEKLKNKNSMSNTDNILWVVAYNQLVELSRDGDPFSKPLEFFASVNSQNPEINNFISDIKAISDIGAPSIDTLIISFNDVYKEIITEDFKNKNSLISRIQYAISDVFLIKRLDVKQDDEHNNLYYAHQTEVALKKRNLKLAISYIKNIKSDNLELTKQWTIGAENRVTLDKAMEDIRQGIINIIGL